MAGTGYGKYSARQVLAKFAPAGAQPMSETEEQAESHGFTSGISSVVRRVFGGDANAIVVRGQDDLLVYRARCCNPIRGEAIVGYVTRGKGVAVHSINCPNVTNLLYEPDRRIDVLWAGDKDGTGQPVSYPVKITLLCDDRWGMLKQITAVISDTKTNIRNMESRSQNGQACVDVVLEIADLKHLQKIMDGVRQIPGVHDVQRLQKI
jgi:GTP pyrophosphokinase